MPESTASTTLPDLEPAGNRARQILADIRSWGEFARLEESTLSYPDCWGTYTGYTSIACFDLKRDAGPLLVEALRVMAMKTAVFEMTGGDEHAAELVIPAPVDEMVHALLAQHNLARRFETETGLHLVHMTDQERFGWEPGDYTHRLYRAAWKEEPPARYWIDKQETARRHGIIDGLLQRIGINELGRSHTLDFGQQPQPVAV
ncbi:hypothetical protein ACTWQF_34200 [Streptomyces sp. 8N114]|uniref:hypothetical protein n=1 Tax=Streptomyces sp. 8N114 TaxID=3457419 RepID=UPI003FD0C312